MEQISSKTGKVADFPMKMNLQLFADENDGTPNLEESAEFNDDAREFNLKMDKFAEERTPKAETETEKEPVKEDIVENPEVVEPESKPKQDSETNKAFQEMRKQLEAEKARADEIEAKAKKADDLIAQQYGASHGIYTVDQYEQRIRQEREQEDNERYEAAGLTPQEIEKLRRADELERESLQSKQEKQQEETRNQWGKLYSSYPDLVESSKLFEEGKTPDWYTQEMIDEISRGASPLAAYRNAHFETIMQRTLGSAKEVAKQEALDKINSKEHLAPNASTGGEVDHVEIDEETMRAYRALNKNKSDAQIRAWHKKNAN